MEFLADLHIHSPFSRATSQAGTLVGLFAWARVKGLQVIGTGDFTHPGWLAQLKEQLVPAEPGLFRLKSEQVAPALPGIDPEPLAIRFLLTAEISSIYKRHGQVRKVHNLLLAPDFASVERINTRLAAIGNIEADGRPILGLDSHDLLEILLEQAPEGFLVPAHIWTPWFSLFGSKSGFNAVEECFGDLAGHVFALETGLSSDPEMNRLVSALDRFALISNSDCHSPAKLGREANLFATGLDFFAMREALRSPSSGGFRGTIEFFPEEGKYHLDGHRKCGVCLEPAETRRLAAACPACGRPLTVGVLHRVLELADRTAPLFPAGAPRVHSLIPLPEVLGEILAAGPATKTVLSQYGQVIARFGSEMNLLLRAPLEEINPVSPLLAEAVQRIREGKVIRRSGYDGEFGIISVFAEGELARLRGQANLFGTLRPRSQAGRPRSPLPAAAPAGPLTASAPPRDLNPEQEEAAASEAPCILVTAGPGTGKTFTLVERMARLLAAGQARPESCTAITFTNRAASEIRERLLARIGPAAGQVFIGTFHGFCLHWWRQDRPELWVAGEEDREILLRNLYPDLDRRRRAELTEAISRHFQQLDASPQAGTDPALPEIGRYLKELARQGAVDLDGVVPGFLVRLSAEPELRERLRAAVSHLFVDEFQDLNRAQYELVLALAATARVFAIGDPDQAIYGFRGSDLRCFLEFGSREATRRLTLSRNYRSAPAFLEAAGAVIRRNPVHGGTVLLPQSETRTAVELHTAATEKAEAELVARRLEELLGGTSHLAIHAGRGGQADSRLSFGDFAILYRLSSQAEPLAEALARRGIPFQLVGGRPFFLRGGIRPVYSFIRAAAGGSVAEHLALLRDLKGCGRATLRRLEQAIPLGAGDFFDQADRLGLGPKAHTRLRTVAGALRHFGERAAAEGLAAALRQGLAFLALDAGQPEAKRLLELAGAFGRDLPAFAHHLEQNAAAAVYDERAEAVALMTIHAAKGLEFPAVFLTGLEEGLFPCALEGLASDPEEERRLFYVGLTRARQHLLLTGAARRTLYGRTLRQRPSRFLEEIPARLIKRAAVARLRHKTATQMKLF